MGNGRFTLKKLLGQGGMGMVWLAYDEQLQELVALKFLPPQTRFDPAAFSLLRKETARSRKLSHPNIIRIHDLHQHEGEDPFIAMEYVDGQTLHALRFQQPNELFSWDKLAPLVRQLCEALDHAHSDGIVHRDLKPSNLMLRIDGRLKLADFGLATVISDSFTRMTGTTGGTPAYMSPQQMEGKPPQPTDDIYSLGATLYELLTGTPPFHTGQIVQQVLHTPPTTLRERLIENNACNEMPREVEAMIMACLAKNREHRPRSARAVADWIGLPSSSNPRSLEATLIPQEGEVDSVGGAVTLDKRLWVASAVLLCVFGAAGWFWATKRFATGRQTVTDKVVPVSVPTTNVAGTTTMLTATTTNVTTRERSLISEDFERFAEGTTINTKYRQGTIVIENGNRFLRIQGNPDTNRSYVLSTVKVPDHWKEVKVECRLRTRNLKLNIGSPRSGVWVSAEIYGDINDTQNGKPRLVVYPPGGFPIVRKDSEWTLRTGKWSCPKNIPPSARNLHVGFQFQHASGIAELDDIKVTIVIEEKVM